MDQKHPLQNTDILNSIPTTAGFDLNECRTNYVASCTVSSTCLSLKRAGAPPYATYGHEYLWAGRGERDERDENWLEREKVRRTVQE